jgi:raffinose/stachyose/melibiose transport system substrate-binding protein
MQRWALYLLLSLVLVMSGCGNASDSDGKVTIEFFQYKVEARDTFEALIADFEQENPGIKVELVTPPDAETVLKTRVAKNDVPDIVAIGANDTFKELAGAGVFQEMTDAPEVEQVETKYVEMIRQVSAQEELYALPYAANANGVIYNKALFAEQGLSVPQTWEEWITLCDEIKESGNTPFYFTFKDAWTTLPAFNALAANTQGEDFFAKRHAGDITFEKGYREAADKYLQLLEYGQSDPFGKGYADGNAAFAKGESFMYLQGIWAIPEIKKANPDVELGVFPYPVADDPAESLLVSGVDLLFALSKESEHAEAAETFIRFLLEPENAETYITEQNAFSAVKGVTQDDPILEGLLPSLEEGRVVGFPDHSIPLALQLENHLQEFSRKQDATRFLQQMDREWDRIQNR